MEEVLEPACNYVILVNKTQNIVQVKNQKEDGTEELVKTFVCSCGRKGHGMPAGTFKTSDYYEWRSLKDGSYGRYAIRFNKRILFHSVPYVFMTPDSLEWEQYNLLGETASLGCVRLAVADAKWISVRDRRLSYMSLRKKLSISRKQSRFLKTILSGDGIRQMKARTIHGERFKHKMPALRQTFHNQKSKSSKGEVPLFLFLYRVLLRLRLAN